MKKSLIALALAGAFSSAAFAQSSVTIYGIIDETIHHEADVTAAGTPGNSSKTLLDGGAFNGNRLGFKGTEDLGGGMSALFVLEDGFNLNTGTQNQSGRLFGRQAYVGLSLGAPATITLGRQNATFFQLFGASDPLGWGNSTQDEWQQSLITGIRYDNTLQYTGTFGPVGVLLQHAFGGVAGSTSNLSSTGGAATLAFGPFNGQAGYQEAKDAVGDKETTYGAGFSLAFAPVTGYAQYFEAKRDPGFDVGANSGVAGDEITSAIGTFDPNYSTTLKRTDKYFVVGAGFQATPADLITVAYMYDKITNVDATGSDGKLSTIYAYYAHNLSVRTTVYVGLNYGKASDGAVSTTTAGGSEILGLGAGRGSGIDESIGIRHRF
jgi:predicted porin